MHCNTLPHTATHCHTLQHTATHCHTLQHTATHCHWYCNRHCNWHCNCSPLSSDDHIHMLNNVAQGTFFWYWQIMYRVPKSQRRSLRRSQTQDILWEVPNTRHPVGGPKDQTSYPRLVCGAKGCLVPNDILSQSMSCPTGCLIMSLGPPRGCLWDLHGLFLEVWGSSPNYRALAESRALLQKEIEQNKMRYLAKYHYPQRMFLLWRSLFVWRRPTSWLILQFFLSKRALVY